MTNPSSAFDVAEVRVVAMAFGLRLSGRRQRMRYEFARSQFGAVRDRAEQVVRDRIIDSINRWARRAVRRADHVDVSDCSITSGNSAWDDLFADPDERRLRVTIRAIPADVARIIAPPDGDMRVAEGLVVMKYARPKGA